MGLEVLLMLRFNKFLPNSFFEKRIKILSLSSCSRLVRSLSLVEESEVEVSSLIYQFNNIDFMQGDLIEDREFIKLNFTGIPLNKGEYFLKDEAR